MERLPNYSMEAAREAVGCYAVVTTRRLYVMDENALPFGYNFGSQEATLDFLRDQGYRVEFTPWDVSDLPDRAQELIGAMTLISHYDDVVAPFQVFLTELDVPRQVKRIRRTDLRIILEPFYRRYPQGDYLFIFALPGYASVALVSPKRIRGEPRQPILPEEVATTKLQLRILTLDPRHLYHTDWWVLEQIRLGPEDQTAEAIWRKHLAAFDVERVTRQFYEGYKTVLAILKAELAAQRRVGAMPAQVHAFAQQLLNRLMFLYFVQKKGWLRWNGEPDPHYLRSLWERYRDGKRTADGGFHGWLQALFLDAFNNRRAAVAANSALPDDVRASFLGMPFLNGGLFEGNELDDLGFSVSDEFFVQLFDRFQREEPGFLERYNFTMDESTPLDVEVAVDPEMLGKVYESLVAEEERHAAGIFYTPREEIDYMCRLSLIEYLHEQSRLPKDALIPLVMEPRRLLETPEACPERERGNGIVPFGGLSQTRQHEALRVVEKALREIRVVDPAVGSGSFLVGMMKALASIQQVIAEKLERKRFNEFDLKRRIIMENLYGVDVKDWAVRACELRLWLSLTIEAEERDIDLYTNPVLPKLSFRVRQGDSLVEEVADVPLMLRGAYAHVPPQLEHKLNKLAEMKADYFGGRSLLKRGQIEREESKLLQGVLNAAIDRLNRQLDALRRPLEEQAAFEGMGVARPRQLQLDEERRKEQIRALTQQRDDLIKVRTNLAKGKTPPFFLWDVGFGEVFAEKGGFDICIGNPPYVRHQDIGPPTEHPGNYAPDDWRVRKQAYKDKLSRSVQALWGDSTRVDRKSDLYVYFYHVGLSLLRPGGVFCFINSNSWLDVGYGARLQEFLLRRMRLLQVIDNHAQRSFAQAEINTVIALLQRPEDDIPQWDYAARFVAYKKPFDEAITMANLVAIERARSVLRDDDLRVYPVSQRELLLDGAQLAKEEIGRGMELGLEYKRYEGAKWGGKYLRAPDIFLEIWPLPGLIPVTQVARIRLGVTTGANAFFFVKRVGPDHYLTTVSGQEEETELPDEYTRPVIRTSSECKRATFSSEDTPYRIVVIDRTCHERRVREYIAYAEKLGIHRRPFFRSKSHWYEIRHPVDDPLAISEITYTRYFVLSNPDHCVLNKNFYGIQAIIQEDLLYGLLASTLSFLFFEMNSRKPGAGASGINVSVASRLKVVDPTRIEGGLLGGILEAARSIRSRAISDIDCEVRQPDRVQLDRLLFRALELDSGLVEELYEGLLRLVTERLARAASVEPKP